MEVVVVGGYWSGGRECCRLEMGAVCATVEDRGDGSGARTRRLQSRAAAGEELG
jgi:hypothetical protein